MKTDKELIEEIKHYCVTVQGSCDGCVISHICTNLNFMINGWPSANWEWPEAVKVLALLRLGLLKVDDWSQE